MGEITATGAQIVCHSLASWGVTTLFGVPGDTGVSLYDALAATPELQHVLMNDERGAVFAADAYARRLNRTGVVEVSSGGGATFCIGGLGESYAASVPLVVISSDIHRGSSGTGALTETDQVKLFSGVTKLQRVVRGANEVSAALAEAFEQAVSGRPGPTVVIIPEDVLDEVAETTIPRARLTIPVERVRPDPASLGALAEALTSATRPVIVAGGGVHLSNAYEALRQLAHLAGVPVATTIHGKGAIAEDDPLSLGVVGANGGRNYATDFVADADVTVLIGTRANSTDTDGFRAPGRSVATVAHIDIEADSRASHNYPDGIQIVGDAREALESLLLLVSPAPDRLDRTCAAVVQLRDEWTVQSGKRPTPEKVMDPWRVIDCVRESVPTTSTVVGDCGTPTPYLASMWVMQNAGRTMITPRGHGPMGYAIPAALGAAFANPGEQVVAFTTDGSLLMAAGALETAARSALPIVYVHFSNGSLGWIKALQELYLEGRFFGTQISAFDSVAVASGFGLVAERVTTLEGLTAAVRRAVATGRPSFIDVPCPDEHDCLPPVVSWERAASGAEKSRPAY